MSKDWNYAHMWDTMRRALEESALEGLEVTPRDVLNGMYTLETREERHRKEREERKEREKLESFPIWQLETIREDGKERWRIYRDELIRAMDAVVNNTKAEEAEECE